MRNLMARLNTATLHAAVSTIGVAGTTALIQAAPHVQTVQTAAFKHSGLHG